MAVQTKAGSFVLNTVTGNQAVTGVGFQPKALIFWVTAATADGTFTANDRFCIGMATAASVEGCAVMASDNGLGASPQTERLVDNSRCFEIMDHAGVKLITADFVSMNADGFTVNLVNAGTAFIVHYFAIGGADITNAKVMTTLTTDITTGNHAKTGVGFQPDLVLLVHANGHTTLGSVSTHAGIGIGAACASGQASTARKIASGVATSAVGSVEKNSMITMVTGSAPVTLEFEASLVSLDADGFTWNVTTADNAAHALVALFLKGGSYYVGTDTQKTSAGTQAKTGTGITPSGLFFFSRDLTSGTTVDTANSITSIGAADGTTQGAGWGATMSGQTTSVAGSRVDATKALVMASAAASPTVAASATVSSFDSSGYTLNWGAADATAREFGVIGFGSPAPVVSSSVSRTLLGAGA